MKYSIRHVTRFDYDAPIHESCMEVRKQPRAEGNQRVYRFTLTVQPTAQVSSYVDYLENTIHYFDIPRAHLRLTITAEALVEVMPPPLLPEALGTDAWDRLDAEVAAQDFWEDLVPSQFTEPTPMLNQLRAELNAVERRDDPLTVLRDLNQSIYDAFDYTPNLTEADSPIDLALESRKGVCQDFAHVMIALVRMLGIPCRYVSGYLYTGKEDHDRSSAQDATHAWVEAWLPDLGWIGLDPTNNLIVGDRHIRVAVGRDYADVPPTHGVFRGEAESELSVGVQVKITDDEPFDEDLLPMSEQPAYAEPLMAQQEQQQQQQ